MKNNISYLLSNITEKCEKNIYLCKCEKNNIQRETDKNKWDKMLIMGASG